MFWTFFIIPPIEDKSVLDIALTQLQSSMVYLEVGVDLVILTLESGIEFF